MYAPPALLPLVVAMLNRIELTHAEAQRQGEMEKVRASNNLPKKATAVSLLEHTSTCVHTLCCGGRLSTFFLSMTCSVSASVLPFYFSQLKK